MLGYRIQKFKFMCNAAGQSQGNMKYRGRHKIINQSKQANLVLNFNFIQIYLNTIWILSNFFQKDKDEIKIKF